MCLQTKIYSLKDFSMQKKKKKRKLTKNNEPSHRVDNDATMLNLIMNEKNSQNSPNPK